MSSRVLRPRTCLHLLEGSLEVRLLLFHLPLGLLYFLKVLASFCHLLGEVGNLLCKGQA